MLNPDYDSDKFLYKIQKWGNLNPDVNFVLYTDHSIKIVADLSFNFTIIAVVNDCLDFTRKLNWINYFGQSSKHVLKNSEEKLIIEVEYENGPQVRFVLFESNMPPNKSALEHSKILVNKKDNLP